MYKYLSLLLFASLFLAAVTLSAQDEDVPEDDSEQDAGPWKTSGNLNITGSRVKLTNWQAGGENSIAVNGFFAYKVDYKKENITWNNFVEAAFGASRLAGSEYQKTSDRYEIGTKLGYKLNNHWDATAFSTFRTQFTEGFNIDPQTDERRRISHAFAPAYLFGGLGGEYEPTDWFQINIAPLSTRITHVRIQQLADQGAFGVQEAEFDDQGNKIADGKNTRHEFGGYVKIWLRKEIFEDVTVETKADFFSNYIENPENLNVTWDVMINMKVNSWLSANLTTNLIYDDDIPIQIGTDAEGNPITGPRTQFKQVFGVGLAIDF